MSEEQEAEDSDEILNPDTMHYESKRLNQLEGKFKMSVNHLAHHVNSDRRQYGVWNRDLDDLTYLFAEIQKLTTPEDEPQPRGRGENKKI